MSFFEFLVTNIILGFLVGIGIFYVIHILIDKKIRLTKRLLLSYPLYIGVYGVIGALVYYPAIQRGHGAGGSAFVTLVETSIIISYCIYLFGKGSIKKILPSTMIASALNAACMYALLNILSLLLPQASAELILVLIAFCSATVVIIMHLISKTNIIHYLRELFTMDKLSVFIPLTYFVTISSVEYYAIAVLRRQGIIENISILVAVSYLVAIICISFLSKGRYNKMQRQQSETLLLQSQLYVKRLENIQQELRLFQHDYKNIVAGLYASADEGNTQAVKEYIDSKILNIGEDVQNDIRQTNQFVKITNMELKGLLLVKLMDAKQADVTLDLEVLYEVKEIAIDTSDLMRIMGILLDNAIEEAQTTVTKKVSVVILQEDKKTTIMVKNDISSNVDMSNIWKNGYSTKGKNRGLGLSSYQKMLNNYDNAFCETKIENEQFMQILVVS